MHLPHPRGPLSSHVVESLGHPDRRRLVPALGPEPVTHDADAQLALWVLYELHYRGFDDVQEDREWDLDLLALRRDLETRFEHELRDATRDRLAQHDACQDVGDDLFALVAADDSPSPAAFLQRHATRDQALDFLRERSLQQAKESDPQAFVVPRLTGPPKAALAELQYDEFGGGRPERLHQTLYANALEAAGLDASYGAHVDSISAVSLASANAMSLFALHRRLRGAAVGHFAAFEASSSAPSRRIAAGLERLGFPAAVAAYFHEHVEADAVHEQVAVRDVCGGLVAQEPHLRDDVLLGAAVALHLEGLSAVELLDRWCSSSLDEEVAS